jgi:hypothetical protein
LKLNHLLAIRTGEVIMLAGVIAGKVVLFD